VFEEINYGGKGASLLAGGGASAAIRRVMVLIGAQQITIYTDDAARDG
jgi:hypothetical protein